MKSLLCKQFEATLSHVSPPYQSQSIDFSRRLINDQLIDYFLGARPSTFAGVRLSGSVFRCVQFRNVAQLGIANRLRFTQILYTGDNRGLPASPAHPAGRNRIWIAREQTPSQSGQFVYALLMRDIFRRAD